ncbi:MAG: hypothetical protein C0401_09950 [Anaerolinea sp.]|nr:hypothetical protein [Anaerolinea sp.]
MTNLDFRRRNVIILVGKPCSGKSTLANSLAECLGGTHISVGALIRLARESNMRFRQITEEAYDGRAMFEPNLLADLIADVIDAKKIQSGPLIIDAAPPIDRVAAHLGWISPLLIELKMSWQLAEQRRAARVGETNHREDDNVELFRRRGRWCVEHLPETIAGFPTGTRHVRINANFSRSDTLRQALSYILLTISEDWLQNVGGIKYLNEGSGNNSFSETKGILDRALQEHGGRPVGLTFINQGEPSSSRNRLVLLLKPGLHFPDDIIARVERLIASHGYKIRVIAAWDGTAVADSMVGRAHLDLAYLHARWPEHLGFGQRMSKGLERDRTFVGGYSYGEHFGFKRLDEIWNEDGDHPPIKVGPCAYVIPAPDFTTPSDTFIVNGHIPSFLSTLEDRGNVTYAIAIEAVSVTASSWLEMRNKFIGTTIPGRAAIGSLRRMAFDGELDIIGEISFRNNGFHLSAGPLEAVREFYLWFGYEECKIFLRTLGINTDQPLVNIPLEGEEYATLWLNEATECLDVESRQLRTVLSRIDLSKEDTTSLRKMECDFSND